MSAKSKKTPVTEEIAANLYRIEVPLPETPLKALNSYVVKSPERNLVVDTGWNRDECMNAMQAGLEELEVDVNKTDFFITHMHSDHLGLVSRLAPATSEIYFNKPDADWISPGINPERMIRFARLNGFPEDELEAGLLSHPAFKFRSREKLDFHILKEGDTLTIGDYTFTCIETPGHTKGHLCLYESRKKIFVAGDHVLKDISPNIQLWDDDWNPLKLYLESLDKVDQLDVDLVLPGHRTVFRTFRERIQELKHHHRERVDEIVSILEQGSMDAFRIGGLMKWDIVCDSWESFPVSQKRFAVGEVIAHLKYLEDEGIVRRETENQHRTYSLNRRMREHHVPTPA